MPPWLQELMNNNRQNLYSPHNQQVSPVVTSANPSGVGTGGTGPVNGSDFLTAFVSALTNHLGAQDRLAPQQLQQGNDLLFGRNLGNNAAPSVNDARGSGNPWATASWQGPEDRYAAMENHTGAYAPTNPAATVATRFAQQQQGVRPFQQDFEEPDIPHANPGRATPDELYAFRRQFEGTPLAYKGPTQRPARPKNQYAIR